MAVVLRLLRLMRPHAAWMALAVLLAAIVGLAQVALMATAGWFITGMALAGVAGATMNYFTPAAVIRGLAIIRTAGRYAERVIGHEATLRFVAGLRPWLFARLEHGAPGNLRGRTDGDLLTRLRADIDRLEHAFLRIVGPLAAALAVAVPSILLMAAYDRRIAALAAVLLAVAGLVLPIALLRAGAPAAARLTAGTAALGARLVDEVEGLAELAVYDPDGLHRRATLAASDALVADERVLSNTTALSSAGLLLAGNALLVAVLLLGLPAVAAGALAPADLPMLALLGLALFDAVAAVPLAVQAIPAVVASAGRVFEIADRPPGAPDPADPAPLPCATDLRLDAVSFRYPGATHGTLDGVTLDLPAGRRIAVVGPSGAGKSTLAQLAMRFELPHTGEVSLGGVGYGRLTGGAVHSRIALVGQRDHLFATTIRDNLLLGDPDADEERLRAACRVAQILDFVEALPEGFDTFVGAHGTKLSGGESRRLLVARALVAGRPILILDEPTEGLDPDTEARLLDALLDAPGVGSLLLLTHRPARLDRMDEIVRLEGGRVVSRFDPRTTTGTDAGGAHSGSGPTTRPT